MGAMLQEAEAMEGTIGELKGPLEGSLEGLQASLEGQGAAAQREGLDESSRLGEPRGVTQALFIQLSHTTSFKNSKFLFQNHLMLNAMIQGDIELRRNFEMEKRGRGILNVHKLISLLGKLPRCFPCVCLFLVAAGSCTYAAIGDKVLGWFFVPFGSPLEVETLEGSFP